MARQIARALTLSTALVTLASGSAFAQLYQNITPNVGVADRDRPDYDPLGIRTGGFLLTPSITVEELYDSNVFADDDDEEDDFATIVSPRLSLESQFSRHALNFSAGADGAAYYSTDENNYIDAFGQASGQLDVGRANSLSGSVRVARGHQDRDDSDIETSELADQNDEDVTVFYTANTNVFWRQQFNRLYYRVGASALRRDYEDGEDADRDRIEYSPTVEVGYSISPRFDVFTRGVYRMMRYDQSEQEDREFDGYQLLVGSNIDLTSLIFGTVYVGYEQANFDGDTYDDIDGVSFGGGLTYNVTRLTSVTLSGQRQVQPTQRTESGGNQETTADLRVDHELLRNVILNGRVGWEQDDFEDTTDDTYRAGAGVSYLINRNFRLSLDYTFSTRDSDESDREYDRNQILLGLRAAL
ncbi:outer membrane beta-barrel protein [Marinivivus vitaminiproducens]|uniref:outer membrane beta-barrel protein n=1 Tax=Marinivivus vitaminiproducens TaxID=3035935 RepID=UPI0027A5A69A|nr:outer membrane beta-barrel protein [Geminicoccaceae bacterium SCSIO 64248]